MKLVQYNEYCINIMETDGLVIYHQGVSSHSAFPAVSELMIQEAFANGLFLNSLEI